MENSHNVRKSQASNPTICTASISSDGIRWFEVEVVDISSTGLEFYSTKSYSAGEILNFNLNVYRMISEFNLLVEGCIVEKGSTLEGHFYVIEFSNIDKKVQVQLDEIIKANISDKNNHEFAVGDGMYSFILAPRSKSCKPCKS